MDNQAFELQGETLGNSSQGKEWPQREVRRSSWSLMKIFLACLLACSITTVIGVLILSLVYLKNTTFILEETLGKDGGPSSPKPPEKHVDLKYQFLNHLKNSKVHQYPGGEVQWARYRSDVTEYPSPEEEVFGQSLHTHGSHMTLGTLKIRSRGLRAPHWHFNANEHGYLLQGTAWIGVIGGDDNLVTTYNVTTGQVVFFPRNTVHWVKNMGAEDCVFLMFFTTHEELETLDVDDAFFSTPEDIAARALKPQGGVNFIRTFQKQGEDQAVNLPPNLAELLHNVTYVQSPDHLVWRYFYNLKGSSSHPVPGGLFQWARYRLNGVGLKDTEKIFSESLHKHDNTLTLATLKIFSNQLGQPHFHLNANEMGYVISGCGQVGVILSGVASTFNIDIGDVFFFPVGSQHYIKSVCEEDLLLVLAYSTGSQLQTLGMKDYFRRTADHILAQLFFKNQAEFTKLGQAA